MYIKSLFTEKLIILGNILGQFQKQALAWGPATLLKRDPKNGVFLWNLQNF